MKNSKLVSLKETLILATGEILCSAIVCAVFILIKKYDYTVLLGTAVGSLAIVLNFMFISIAVNRAIDQAFALRDTYGTDTADEPAADAQSAEEDGAEDAQSGAKLDATMRFVNEQSLRVNRISKVSYITRTASLLILLVLALLTKWFNPIATVIPMLAFRPIIMIEGLIRHKLGK